MVTIFCRVPISHVGRPPWSLTARTKFALLPDKTKSPNKNWVSRSHTSILLTSASTNEQPSYMPSRSSSIAIVTGAAQGIGQSIALRLAQDGLDVAVNDLPEKDVQLQEVVHQIQAAGRRSIAVAADVSDEEGVRKMIAQTVRRLGGLDVMVANAGYSTLGSLVEFSTQDWDRMMSVNLRGVMLCYKYAAIQMIKQGRGGRILGASSIYGKRGGPMASAYSASKFAIRGLTQSAALELAPHNITVNAYAPGFINTAFLDAALDASNGAAGMAENLNLPANIPVAEPDAVASWVAYLVKPEAYFITGQTVMMNGGMVLD